MLPLGLAIFILYTLLFPLVLAWKTRARFERVRRFQRRRIAEEAKRGIALDTSHFVWDSKDTNADPLSWLYSFLRPKCHALLLDGRLNSAATVRLNIYQSFLLAAIKFHCYVKVR